MGELSALPGLTAAHNNPDAYAYSLYQDLVNPDAFHLSAG